MKKLISEALNNKERFIPRDFKKKLDEAISEALKKVDLMIETLDGGFASHASRNGRYFPVQNNGGWQTGFWPGILWLSYELSGDDKYKKTALSLISSFSERLISYRETLGHDAGFLYILSCVAAYKLTGDEEAKAAALDAADYLRSRFHEKAGFIQAWGRITDTSEYRLIVDCLLNIPLLYWASEVTGDGEYKRIAYSHFRATVDNAVRENGSSFHTFFFDPETGLPLRGATKQGKDDSSCWARGHGWVIYGMMLTRKYIDDPDAISIARAATNYYLNRLPADFVPYWDLEFKDCDGEERDSSAAAICVCGMLELLKYLPEGEEKDIVKNAIDLSMDSLFENYSTKCSPEANGLLLHAVYSKPDGVGVDEMNIWGCYFYLEALRRLKGEWELYW